MTASISKTARIGDDIAAQILAEVAKTNQGIFNIGMSFDAAFGYALISDLDKSDGLLHVEIHPGEIDGKRPASGQDVAVTTLAVVVRLWSSDEINPLATQRTVLDPAMALVDRLCCGVEGWLFKDALMPGGIRKFDGNASCVNARAILGDHLSDHLCGKNEFHVPIICEFKHFG